MNDRDDLQHAWEDYGKRVDASMKLNAGLLLRGEFYRAERTIGPLIAGLSFEAAANALVVLLLGSFVADTAGDMRFAVPGAALFIFAWLALAAVIWQIVALKRVDFAQPVAAVQRELEALRVQRIRIVYWTIVLAPLLWLPLMIVGLRAAGINAYGFGSAYLLANFGAGVFALATGIIAAKRATAGGSKAGDLLAGRSLSDALARLDDVRRFSEEGVVS